MKTFRYILCMLVFVQAMSCRRYLDVSPTDRTTLDVTFSNLDNATTAVNGLYSGFTNKGLIYSNGLYTNISLMSDELKTTNVSSVPFAQNSITPTLDQVGPYWDGHYAIINQCNLVIDHLPDVPGIKPQQLSSWTGEAKFMRAWCYLALTQLFGKVPKVTSSQWENNATLSRSPVSEIQDLVLKDLQDAESSLPHDYADAQTSRIRATKGTATALLVKYYMLKQDWANAAAKATVLINDSAMYRLETNYANVFTDNSAESIWETWFGPSFVNLAFSSFLSGARAQYTPSTKIVLAFNASTGDKRTAVAMAGGKVNKYASSTARDKMLRLADIYLLRAEAMAHQGDTTSSLYDLNRIRIRAGLAPAVAISASNLLLEIEQERFLELAFEGQRWYDLVRTGRADAVLAPLKTPNWQPTDVLLPVPQAQINLNPNLLPQNAPF